ncbi:lycopene cyclase family protein, partial [Escherichia coli]
GRVAAYAQGKGWTITEVVREEQGVLPIILGGNHERLLTTADSAPRVGLAAALVHPTTGYSFPDAVRMADLVAARVSDGKAPTSADVREVVHAYS